MYKELTYTEFLEWSQYFAVCPPHQDRSEIQLARLTQITATEFSKNPPNFYDYTISLRNPSKEDGENSDFYTDSKGRRVMKSSKDIDKILDKKMKA